MGHYNKELGMFKFYPKGQPLVDWVYSRFGGY